MPMVHLQNLNFLLDRQSRVNLAFSARYMSLVT